MMTRDEILSSQRIIRGCYKSKVVESELIRQAAHDQAQRAVIEQLQEDLQTAERALRSKGYRKDCDIPACNCGPQWNHGGHAEQRLREISDALPYVNGATILQRIEQQAKEIESHKKGCFRSHPHDEMNEVCELKTEIARLKNELSHWSWVRFKQLEEENKTIREALQGILEIGKRDMTNPKYDGYFEQAQQALKEVS